MEPFATLLVYDLGNGFLRVEGTIVDEAGTCQRIDYDQLPKFMLNAVFEAARKAGAMV